MIRRLSGPEFALALPRLVDIYIDAMGYDPATRQQRIRAWRNDVIKPAFTSIIATTTDQAIGVAYGFLGRSDDWWDTQVKRGLHQHEVPAETAALARDYFEIAEVHVQPGNQGAGIGRRMITELLWNVPATNTLLSTPEVPGEDNPAFSLYRSLGFQDILRDFRFTGDSRPFAVLGRPLPLEKGRG